MKLAAVLLFFSGVMSIPAYATKCDMSLNNGVVVDPTHIRILKEATSTYIQITQDKKLFVSGREINLTPPQVKVLNEYSKKLRLQVPQIVSLAMEGFELGINNGAEKVYSTSSKAFQDRFNEIQWHFREKLSYSKDSYYIAQQNFNEFDKIFSGEYHQEIEHIVTQSLGSIIVAVGDAMFERSIVGSDNHQVSNLQTPSDEITNLEKELITELTLQTHSLNEKVVSFCNNLKLLDKFEEKIRSTIPELGKLDLITQNVKNND